jgi:hypothetical protein
MVGYKCTPRTHPLTKDIPPRLIHYKYHFRLNGNATYSFQELDGASIRIPNNGQTIRALPRGPVGLRAQKCQPKQLDESKSFPSRVRVESRQHLYHSPENMYHNRIHHTEVDQGAKSVS